MNLFKRVLAVALAVLCISSLSACSLFGHDYNPSKTGIYITSDYRVFSAEFADFDNSDFDTPRYVASDFQSYAQETVKSYNSEKANLEFYNSDTADAKLPVSIETLEFSGDDVKLILEFQNFETFLDFYGTTESVPVKNLVVGTVADGISSGLDFVNMLNADGESVEASDIKSDASYNLVMITGKTEIQCEGKIVYYSKSMKLTDSYTVESTGNSAEFIVFK